MVNIEEGTVVITVRMPEALRDKLADKAEREHRSMNKQVVHMLERGVGE